MKIIYLLFTLVISGCSSIYQNPKPNKFWTNPYLNTPHDSELYKQQGISDKNQCTSYAHNTGGPTGDSGIKVVNDMIESNKPTYDKIFITQHGDIYASNNNPDYYEQITKAGRQGQEKAAMQNALQQKNEIIYSSYIACMNSKGWYEVENQEEANTLRKQAIQLHNQ